MRVLVTCPPMLRQIDRFKAQFDEHGWEVTAANVVQVLSVEELVELVPQHDGWIIGDDPATAEVFAAGKAGNLKAAVKWGIGVDNVDFAAARALGLPIINTPNMFGGEVADLALSYVLALARESFAIDRGIRAGQWPKPAGVSLNGRTLGLIGLGDIGRNLARRALACDMKVVAWDPGFNTPPTGLERVEIAAWPDRIGEADFLALTCALTPANRHMLNAETLAKAKDGVRVVNVARGPLIDEPALIAALQSGKAYSAALDVFEVEPLPAASPLRSLDRCIFGSHNGSNTVDAVERASLRAIELLADFLKS
ncbi:MAG: phosphoglycerate dehydrogenase [Parvibaculum sp.]|nr:phosphoglycerate dehydrogenase [Parvibaculum sp.]